MKIFRIILFGLIFLISILIIWINVRLYSENFTVEEERRDVSLQLNFLENELKHENLGDRMQNLFPEGFVFTNALYGLSWCEYGVSASSADKSRALNEALYAYDQINSPKAKSFFERDLLPEYGAYYAGWNNYLLSKILLLDTSFNHCEEYIDQLNRQCESISNALSKSYSPYLQSYRDECWPADMCVAMASLRNHDRIFQPKYQQLINSWITNVKFRLDPKTGMVPHKTRASNGATIEGARGSSISLILRLMSEIDPEFARDQYDLYRQYFVSTTFGLPSINEYPEGQTGKGDIDSGPVILGVGFAGTIVSIGTFSVFGDLERAEIQYKTINAFGMPCTTSDMKRYVFGKLPIADAFIAWSRSTGLNAHEYLYYGSFVLWRMKFRAISIFTIAGLWLLYYSRRIFYKLRHR